MITLQKITPKDSTIVLQLFVDCADYFQLAEDKFPDTVTLSEFFEDCPPTHTLDDKISLGVFENNRLIGVVDMLRNYVTEGEWMIGLLLLRPTARGNGVGNIVHQQLIKIAQDGGAKQLRIGVVTQNTKGLAFWKGLGYQEIKRTEPIRFGNRDNVVIILQLAI